MLFASKKKKETSKIEEIIKANSIIIARLEADFENLKQRINSLQGLVNRKLGNEETETNKKTDAFDFLRKNPI